MITESGIEALRVPGPKRAKATLFPMKGTHTDDGSGFSETTTAETVNGIDALVSWLEANRIKHAGTRLETYQSHLHGFLDAETQGRELEFSREIGRDQLYNAMFEAAEWCFIYHAFGHEDPNKHLRSVLRHAVQGPEIYDEEEETRTNARNHQFELAFGALLKRTGFAVGFDGAGDLWFPLREWRIFVECKRVQKTKKILPRVDEAHKQLEQCYKSVPDPRHRPAYPSWPAMREGLRAEAQAILNDYKEAWPAEDARTLGAAVEFRRMAWIEAGPFICPTNEVAWHPVHPEYNLGERLFREIADRVRRGV